MRRAALLAIAMVLAVGPAACGGDDGGGGGTVDVSMTEYRFDPAPIAVSADGQLHVTNNGAEVHNLTIPALGKGIQLQPGNDGTLDLKGQKAGTYQVICDITGHAAKGMQTEITIG